MISERKGNFSFLSHGKGIVSSVAPGFFEGVLPWLVPETSPFPCRWESSATQGELGKLDHDKYKMGGAGSRARRAQEQERELGMQILLTVPLEAEELAKEMLPGSGFLPTSSWVEMNSVF